MCEEKGEISVLGDIVHWTFTGFKEINRIGGYIMSSPHFTFMDQIWFFSLRPNGIDLDVYGIGTLDEVALHCMYQEPDFLGLKLLNCSNCNGSSYVIRLGVIGQNSKEISSGMAKWNHDKGSFVAPNLIRRRSSFSELEIIAPNDIFHAFCKVGKTDSAAQEVTEFGFKKLQSDFEELLTSGSYSDVTLIVRDKRIKAHRGILAARSPKFSGMMFYENNTGIVRIHDTDPAVFQEFLHYLYTGNLKNPSAEKITNLYALAKKYRVSDLKRACMNYLSDNLK